MRKDKLVLLKEYAELLTNDKYLQEHVANKTYLKELLEEVIYIMRSDSEYHIQLLVDYYRDSQVLDMVNRKL